MLAIADLAVEQRDRLLAHELLRSAPAAFGEDVMPIENNQSSCVAATPMSSALMDREPIHDILARLGDKWTTAVLEELGNERMRMKELHCAIKGISQRMLIVTLRNLERDGMIVRTVHATIPPRVEYELSELGLALRGVLEPFGAWVLANQRTIEESRRRFDRAAQAKLSGTLTEP